MAMAAMMRVDYRYLRLASVPMYVIAIALLVLVFVPSAQHRGRRLRPLAQAAGRCRRSTRPSSSSSPCRLPRPLVRQARQARPRVLGRHGPVPGDRRAGHRARVQGTRPRDHDRHHPDGVHDVLRCRREPDPAQGHGLGGALALLLVGLSDYQLEPHPGSSDPWVDPLGTGFHTASRASWPSASAACFGTGLGESKVFVPNALNDFKIFLFIQLCISWNASQKAKGANKYGIASWFQNNLLERKRRSGKVSLILLFLKVKNKRR